MQCGEEGDIDFRQVQESGNCVVWFLRKVFEGNFQESMASRKMDLLPQEEFEQKGMEGSVSGITPVAGRATTENDLHGKAKGQWWVVVVT